MDVRIALDIVVVVYAVGSPDLVSLEKGSAAVGENVEAEWIEVGRIVRITPCANRVRH